MRAKTRRGIHAARRSVAIAIFSSGCGAMPIVAFAQSGTGPMPDAGYAALRWRLVGPSRGGRALAIEGIPGDPSTFYFGAVAGGVWRTRNAGVTWQPLTDGQPFASVGALAIAPSDPNTIYVGSGEADMRSDITYGQGMWKSTDAGAHWQSIGLANTRQIGRILVDPHNANVLLVAALGHAYAGNPERGVFRSTDGGQSWSKVLYRDEHTGAIDLAFDPTDPRVVYAALWQAQRTPWSQYPPAEGPGSGIYKSSDGGVTWTEITGHGLPTGQLGRIGLAVARGSGGAIVYALFPEVRDSAAGLYRSDDGGASWRRAGGDPRIGRGWYFGQVFVDPTDANVLYLNGQSILKSVDGGRTYTAIKGAPGGDDYHYVWIDPTNPRRLAFASDQGVGVSLDGGETWSGWYNQPTAQFYHVITDDRWPYWIYGAQQDAGAVGIASRSDYGEITFRDWLPPGNGESGYLAPDPRDSTIIYGGGPYGEVVRIRSDDGSGAGHSSMAARLLWTGDAGTEIPLHLDVAARLRPRRQAHVVLRLADPAAHDRWRIALGGSEPRFDWGSADGPTSQRAADGRRCVRERMGRDLHRRAVADSRRAHLGRDRQWTDPGHDGSRSPLARRHTSWHGALEQGQHHRCVEAR